jgi:hypothetical protein
MTGKSERGPTRTPGPPAATILYRSPLIFCRLRLPLSVTSGIQAGSGGGAWALSHLDSEPVDFLQALKLVIARGWEQLRVGGHRREWRLLKISPSGKRATWLAP